MSALTWAGLAIVTALFFGAAWAALRFRSRNNPRSAAGLAGWWLLAGVGLVIVVGAWVGLILSLRAAG